MAKINPVKLKQDADKLEKAGKLDQAIGLYRQIIEDNPRDWNTINKVGDLYAKLNKTREATVEYAKVADFYAKDARYWVGANGDPSNTTTTHAWKGLATYVAESSPVTRPIGQKIRRRGTTSTMRPSTRGAALPTRSAISTSRTLPTRSPFGSKTVNPATRDT